MNVIYSDSARQSAEEFGLLQEATQQLEEILRKSAPLARVEWNRQKDDNGEDRFTIRLSHGTESASASFAEDELHSRFEMRYRLARLWVELLGKREEKELENLKRLQETGS